MYFYEVNKFENPGKNSEMTVRHNSGVEHLLRISEALVSQHLKKNQQWNDYCFNPFYLVLAHGIVIGISLGVLGSFS